MAKSGNKSKNPQNLTEYIEEEKHEDGYPCRSGRFPLDALIRRAGYQIYSRPMCGEPIWMKDKVIFKQSEILLRLDPNSVKDAEYQEDLQFDGLE